MSRPSGPNVMPPSPCTVSVVIPALNAEATLGILLDALRAQELGERETCELIVVDNGSSDGTADIARARGATVVNCERPGPAATRNRGIREANGEIIVFLDADVRPRASSFLHEVLSTFRRSPSIGAVGGPILPDPLGATPWGTAEYMVAFFLWHAARPEGPTTTFQPCGNLAVRRESLAAVGLFREELRYLEDMAWCDQLLSRSSWSLWYNPCAIVYHPAGAALLPTMHHVYTYGFAHRSTYMELRPNERYPFRDRPLLFALNLPRLAVRRFRFATRQALRADASKAFILLPWMAVFSLTWAFGVVVGAYRFLKTRSPRGGSGHDSSR